MRQTTSNQQESECTTLAFKLKRFQGNLNTEEKKILDMTIAELTTTLEEKKKEEVVQRSLLKEAEEDFIHFKKKNWQCQKARGKI